MELIVGHETNFIHGLGSKMALARLNLVVVRDWHLRQIRSEQRVQTNGSGVHHGYALIR